MPATERTLGRAPGRRKRARAIPLGGWFLAVAIAAALNPALADRNPFSTAVVVNGITITNFEVEQHAKISAIESDRPLDQQLLAETTTKLIDMTLAREAALDFGIRISDQEVDQRFAEIAGSMQIEAAELLERYDSAGIDRRTVAASLRDQLSWQAFVNRRFGDRVVSEVRPDVVARELDAFENQQIVRYHLYEINLGQVSDADLPRAQNLARNIEARVAAGQSFAEMAKLLSRGASREIGGDLGWRDEAGLGPGLRRILSGIPVGGVSPPFRMADGSVMILHIAERELSLGEGVSPFEFDVVFMSLPLAADATEADAGEAVAALNEVRESGEFGCERPPDESPGASITWERGTLANGARVEWRRGLKVDELSFEFRLALLDLDIGEASEVVRESRGPRFFALCQRTGGLDPLARLQLEQSLSRRLADESLTRYGNSYLADIRARAQIEYGDR